MLICYCQFGYMYDIFGIAFRVTPLIYILGQTYQKLGSLHGHSLHGRDTTSRYK